MSAMCHNEHPFVPGVSVDHAPGESDPRWCNTCGEARQPAPRYHLRGGRLHLAATCSGEPGCVPTDTTERGDAHDVKFHVGTGTVVCTCGAYFETERFGVTMPRSAVSLWAEHVRSTRVTPPAATDEVQP